MTHQRPTSLVALAASVGRRRSPSAETRTLLARAAVLRSEGKTWRQVGADVGRSPSVVFRTVKRWPAEYERALEAPLRASRRLARRVANVEAHARLEAARTRALVERHTEDTLSWALAKERPIQLRLRVAKWVLDYFDSIPEESVSPGPVPLADGDDEAGVMLRAREHGATEEEMAALLIALDARKTR